MSILKLVANVEQTLADFYGFRPASEASSHLVTKDELKASLGDNVTRLPEFAARGGVFLNQQADGDLFIGIHLDQSLQTHLNESDPSVRLDDKNLDAFCILVEEVSHFHLLLNRAANERGVSKLELEWQGEVDKLLVAALTLHKQAGHSHVEPLARKLYDEAIIVAKDAELYWEATRHAARFWRNASKESNPLGGNVRELLRASYRASWREKLEQIEGNRRSA